MIRLKRERQKQRNWCRKLLYIFCKTGEGAADYFSKEIWDDLGFCLLPKIPMPAKENSRAWVWALQQNIMGLSFEHTQLILKHTQQSPTSFKILKIGQSQDEISVDVLWTWINTWYLYSRIHKNLVIILSQFREPQEYKHLCLWILGWVLDLAHFGHAPHLDFHECSREFALTLIGGSPTSTPT